MNRWIGWAAAALALAAASTAWACPGCKEALFDPGEVTQKAATARGYALSIGLLLGVPVALFAGITALIVRSRRGNA